MAGIRLVYNIRSLVCRSFFASNFSKKGPQARTKHLRHMKRSKNDRLIQRAKSSSTTRHILDRSLRKLYLNQSLLNVHLCLYPSYHITHLDKFATVAYTHVKISQLQLAASLSISRQQVVFALFVPSCQQAWNNLWITCNKLDRDIRLVTMFS